MKLLAGSLNVEVDEFLHAGYLSAYPRSFGPSVDYRFEGGLAKVDIIDVKKALTLKSSSDGDDTASDTAMAEVSLQAEPFPPASMSVSEVRDLSVEGLSLAIVFFFFTYLVSLYYRRIRKVQKPGWRPWLLTGVPILLLVVFFHGVFPAYQERHLNSLGPPWKGLPIQAYEDPEAATQAILHGLIAHALPGCPVEASGLAAIQHEVAFPVAAGQLTPGMSYAVRAYGRDGWGRDFSFKPLDKGRYQITSAGADGVQGTQDDVTVVTPARHSDDWEQHVNGVYVRRVKGELVSFIHRIDHRNFRRQNAGEADKLTGTDLFDMLSLSEMLYLSKLFQGDRGDDELDPVLAQLVTDRDTLRHPAKTEPLLFLQIAGADDG